MGNGKETAGKLDLGLRTSLGGGLSRNEFPMEARVPIALEFEEQNYASMSHGFPPTQGDFAGLGQESHSSSHLQFLEVHIKPEPRMNEGSEDIDVDYMMEKPIEFVNGNGTVTEEQERRRIRRERNKVAASKCRKKRKEHVKTLVEASEDLENQNNDLQGQISKLQAEIKQLEFMLDSHSCSKYSHSQQEDEEYGLNTT